MPSIPLSVAKYSSPTDRLSIQNPYSNPKPPLLSIFSLKQGIDSKHCSAGAERYLHSYFLTAMMNLTNHNNNNNNNIVIVMINLKAAVATGSLSFKIIDINIFIAIIAIIITILMIRNHLKAAVATGSLSFKLKPGSLYTSLAHLCVQ